MRKRKGSGNVSLPEGVHAVPAKGKTYYYWAPGRGTPNAPKAVSLGTDATHPDFWKKLRGLAGPAPVQAAIDSKIGTFDALIAEYKGARAFTNKRQRTRRHYEHQLSRIQKAWGKLKVESLTVDHIVRMRSKFENTPVAANHLLSMLRTLLKFGLERGYGKINPAREVDNVEILDEQHAKPWPEWAFQFILKNAPEDIRRATFLGRACGQRRSDLVTFGKKHRRDDGLAIKVGKLRDKDHFIPLTKAQLAELDSWSCSDTGPWIISVAGRMMSGDALDQALQRYVRRTPELNGIKLNWHGLRAMAAIDRKLEGAENRAIGASLCLSSAMVEKYIHHIDELQLARGVRDLMEAK
jgi:site-specific recombinase XerD